MRKDDAIRAAMRDEKFLTYFWARVDKSGECWLWIGGTTSGYGHPTHKTVSFPAHRFSYALAHGDVPADLFVCHSCDVRKCVNPAHLWAGSHDQNMADMKAKKRTVFHCGESNGKSRIDAEDVVKIRARFMREHTATLAAEFGITRSNVHLIGKRKTWKHVP